jgi:TPP-dependent pyruvate/acetoin dehydrogenase alpha subunit
VSVEEETTSTDAGAGDFSGLPYELVVALWSKMCTVREFELACIELKRQGLIRGSIHLCIGQEAVGIGATSALRDVDVITSNHRGHAHYLGKGANPDRLMAEILGRSTGYGKGKAGHMLIADVDIGLLGGTGIVGGMLPVAVGQALAFQVRDEDRVVACFFGDGAVNQGAFGETMNLAALWKLPVIFMCENNHYGLTVPLREHLAGDIAGRAAGYGMPGVKVDGNDAIAVFRVTRECVARARCGEGPSLIEAITYRMTGFSTGDQGGYQSEEEMAKWRVRDPLERLERQLREHGILSNQEIEEVRAAAAERVQQARRFAEESPFPIGESLQEDLVAEPRG